MFIFILKVINHFDTYFLISIKNLKQIRVKKKKKGRLLIKGWKDNFFYSETHFPHGWNTKNSLTCMQNDEKNLKDGEKMTLLCEEFTYNMLMQIKHLLIKISHVNFSLLWFFLGMIGSSRDPFCKNSFFFFFLFRPFNYLHFFWNSIVWCRWRTIKNEKIMHKTFFLLRYCV